MANSGHLDPDKLKAATSENEPSDDNFYDPTNLTVSVGATVTWTWCGCWCLSVPTRTPVMRDSVPPR